MHLLFCASSRTILLRASVQPSCARTTLGSFSIVAMNALPCFSASVGCEELARRGPLRCAISARCAAVAPSGADGGQLRAASLALLPLAVPIGVLPRHCMTIRPRAAAAGDGLPTQGFRRTRHSF